ncbi:MAG: hypothetical protein NTV52_06600 [Acidobacteria bacterium]|nr:hypothetical protein [Acidobacteriota bacterium]
MIARPRPLPAELESLATLLVLMLLTRLGLDPMQRHLPFLPLLDAFGNVAQWTFSINLVYLSGCALVLSRRFIQLGCLLAGSALLLRVLANMPLFSNVRFLDGLMLLLIALYVPARGLLFLRGQYLLLYLGAALNKALDPDWWNGRFIAATLDFHVSPSLARLLEPATALGGLGSMAAESSILVLLLFPRLRPWGLSLLLLFHTFLLVLLHEDFGTFYYTLGLAGPLLFLEWPRPLAITVPASWLLFLPRYSVFQVFRDAPTSLGPTRIDFPHGSATGPQALLFLALSSLPVLAISFTCIPLISRYRPTRLRDLALLVLALTSVGVTFSIRRALTRVR